MSETLDRWRLAKTIYPDVFIEELKYPKKNIDRLRPLTMALNGTERWILNLLKADCNVADGEFMAMAERIYPSKRA